jgi:replication factor C subunit 2/4
MDTVQKRLAHFLKTMNIPHILFHGPCCGDVKTRIINEFIQQIYLTPEKIRANTLFVDCAHAKGIKYIREELKTFAMTNIQMTTGLKLIVMSNADQLTIDAQSALRRCIEVYSNNTRFIIQVDDRHTLLKPILSRFCEIYVPLSDGSYRYTVKYSNKVINTDTIQKLLPCPKDLNITVSELYKLCNEFYEAGISCMDILLFIESSVCRVYERKYTVEQRESSEYAN